VGQIGSGVRVTASLKKIPLGCVPRQQKEGLVRRFDFLPCGMGLQLLTLAGNSGNGFTTIRTYCSPDYCKIHNFLYKFSTVLGADTLPPTRRKKVSLMSVSASRPRQRTC